MGSDGGLLHLAHITNALVGHFESFQSSYFWAVVVTGCGAFLAYRSAFYLLRWRRARLKPFFYVTRLYFIRTDLDDLWLWQFTDLKDFAMAESGDAGCLLVRRQLDHPADDN